MATLEDGLYAMGPKLKDAAFVAKLGKFVAASMKGWEYALKNQDEAVKIVLAADASGGSSAAVQKRQLENVAKLITVADGPKMGFLEPAAFQPCVSSKAATASAAADASALLRAIPMTVIVFVSRSTLVTMTWT